jgi:WD40 repeat protein
MGCGASAQPAQKERPDGTKYVDEDDGEEISDEDANSDTSVTSDTSTASSKSITRVTTTRGRMASSSTTTPKLHHKVYDSAIDDDTQQYVTKRPVQPTPPAEQFLFGDFNVDPKDVARQRVERLNRIRRPGRLQGLGGEDSAVIVPQRKPTELFVFNDLVVQALDEDEMLPDMSAASIPIPTGFRRLSSLTVRTLIGHTDRVKALVIGREEKSFLSAAITDCVVAMSDLRGQELNCYPGHDAYIVALALSRDGKYFASSARDGTIGVWEYSTNREHAMKKQVRTFGAEEAQNAISISLAFGHNGRHLIAGGQDGCCRVWEIDRPGITVVYERHSNVIVSVSPHPSELLVASASGDKTIHIWKIETGETMLRLQGHESAVISVSFTLDGKRLLSNDDRTCRLWCTETGDCALTLRLDQIVTKPPASPKREPRPEPELLTVTRAKDPTFTSRLTAALGGPNTTAARAAQMERVTARTIFTVSALLPGPLSNSYFAVASTTGEVFIVNCVNGVAEAVLPTKAPVFAMHTGSSEKILFGDIFGNVYVASFR